MELTHIFLSAVYYFFLFVLFIFNSFISVSNRCIIGVLCDVFVLSLCLLDFWVFIRAFVICIGLSQISSFSALRTPPPIFQDIPNFWIEIKIIPHSFVLEPHFPNPKVVLTRSIIAYHPHFYFCESHTNSYLFNRIILYILVRKKLASSTRCNDLWKPPEFW